MLTGNIFLYSNWRRLDISTRIRIASELGIKKLGPTHVRDNIIESDGYKIEDVEEALSLENLQKHFQTTETNLDLLWNWLILGRDLPPPTASQPTIVLSKVTGTNAKKKRKQN